MKLEITLKATCPLPSVFALSPFRWPQLPLKARMDVDMTVIEVILSSETALAKPRFIYQGGPAYKVSRGCCRTTVHTYEVFEHVAASRHSHIVSVAV